VTSRTAPIAVEAVAGEAKTPAKVRRRSRSPSWRVRRSLVAYLYIAPALAMFLTFVGAPFVKAVWISFFRWDGITPGSWVGVDNYATVVSDDLIQSSFLHAVVLVLFFATIPIAIGLALASVFRSVSRRSGTVYRVLIFLPQVVSMVVIGVIWIWIYATDGPLNELLRKVGLGGATHYWLGDFTWALPAVGMIGAWALIGLCMVLFTAGIQQIPSSLYDAAKVDGAGRIREFLTVTLPGLRYEIGVALTLTIIAGLRTFDLVFVVTRGGPGTETMVPGLLLYNRAFLDGRVGEACAIAVVLTLLVFAVTLVVDRVATRDQR
jgi:raffinose/stachyose/melibiose transport system permease protein